mgnify:CR=1 FL=1
MAVQLVVRRLFTVLLFGFSALFSACSSNVAPHPNNSSAALSALSASINTAGVSDPKQVSSDEIASLKAEGLIDEADEVLLNERN